MDHGGKNLLFFLIFNFIFRWTMCRLLVMSETIFVNIYWRQYFNENFMNYFTRGAVVVARSLNKSHLQFTFSSCKQRTECF